MAVNYKSGKRPLATEANSQKAIRLVISRIFHLKSTCRWEKSRHLSNYPTKNGSWDSAAEFSGDLIKNEPKSLLPQRMSDILGVCHNWNWIMQIKFQKVRLWLFQCISSPDKSIRHMDGNLQARLALSKYYKIVASLHFDSAFRDLAKRSPKQERRSASQTCGVGDTRYGQWRMAVEPFKASGWMGMGWTTQMV